MAVVETTGLTRRFRRQIAVDRISLQVEEGQVFGFLGPNRRFEATAFASSRRRDL